MVRGARGTGGKRGGRQGGVERRAREISEDRKIRKEG